MANVKVYNMEGKEVGTLELNDAVFGVEVNEHLMHLAVVGQLANKRQGTQSAKTRSEVSGGGRKPWKQKGTGHARQGSTRAAQWVGGGMIFAPKPRDYSVKMNKKEKAAAIKSALSSRVAEVPKGNIWWRLYKNHGISASSFRFRYSMVYLDKNFVCCIFCL